MREHLERLGRFDPERARARFRAGFAPEHMRKIMTDGQMAGVVALKPHDGGLALEHFFIYPGWKNSGLGSRVLAQLILEADGHDLATHLGVLKKSPAAAFYIRHGFQFTHADQWDGYYCRPIRDMSGPNDD